MRIRLNIVGHQDSAIYPIDSSRAFEPRKHSRGYAHYGGGGCTHAPSKLILIPSLDGAFQARLTDHYGILVPQADLDFAIPFLDEDIPLYADPFLLWRSPSQQDQALHTSLLNAFNHLGHL